MKNFIKWLGEIFTESDEKGTKASFSRVFGAIIIAVILRMAWLEKAIPDALMTMFWVLIGYQLLSKGLSSMSPAVLAVAQGFMIKAGAKIDTSKKNE